jgi:hypothetical protein
MSELMGLLGDEGFSDYDALEEMHKALCCADVAEIIDKDGLISAVDAVLFYVNDPAATFALNVFLTKLKSNDDGFYKNSFRV